jgi:hypothetical protein
LWLKKEGQGKKKEDKGADWYCDATFREGWGRDETVEFVRNGESLFLLSIRSLVHP